ncbi:hypothetical protein SLI_0096 [Streptomyces lividans 1326]|uniref:Uncharacterized protein n=1 Tax=Streptomyces lividans 1326 TaxID=1200984 RepID=A0A7U9H848_STRLI|nr:hypothetical protein SLI_0096 [Streptomyces lividans 1326]
MPDGPRRRRHTKSGKDIRFSRILVARCAAAGRFPAFPAALPAVSRTPRGSAGAEGPTGLVVPPALVGHTSTRRRAQVRKIRPSWWAGPLCHLDPFHDDRLVSRYP